LWTANRAVDMLFQRGVHTVHIMWGQVVHIVDGRIGRWADGQ